MALSEILPTPMLYPPGAALNNPPYKAKVSRNLEALAAIASRGKPGLCWAILVLKDGRFLIAAENELNPADRYDLGVLASNPSTSALNEFGKEHSAVVRPLLTQTAELVGAVIVYAELESEPGLEQQLNDVCWFATLAIEQEHLYEDLAYQAHHDPLTGLWNRICLEDEIESALSQSRETGRSVGLLALGIDRFRVINEVLGNQIGNELLRYIAGRLRDTINPKYALARGSGDEFLVLLPDLPSEAPVNTVGQELLVCFADPFHVRDHEIVLRASVGSAVGEADSCSSAELQTRAATALQYAKKLARGQVVYYDRSMAKTPPERLAMEQHLRFALQKCEFELYYQPQIELASGTLSGVEALLRWKHPYLGFISPGTFIPLAEEIGIIEEIGAWTLDEAISQLDKWRSIGISGILMAVNVSALQFARRDFAALVEQKLRKSGTRPSELELEMTESVVMTDFEHGLSQLRKLNNLGVKLAIDDFGTGHSSLAYLQQLPIHRLKIDRIFIREILSREQRPPLVASIIQMAHALGLTVVAEGAETEEQVAALAAMECEDIQGFFYSKPVPAADFYKWAVEGQFLAAPLSVLDFR